MRAQRARELLDAEEQRLRGLRDRERAQLAESLEDSTGELTSFDQHPADVATETHDREVDETLLRALDEGLEEIAAARSRLADGTYGRCEADGEPILDERLEAQPSARYCRDHQAALEERAGAGGT